MWASPNTRLVGTDTPCFRYEGQLSGVYNLTLDESRQVNIGPNATNSLEGSSSSNSSKGTWHLMLIFKIVAEFF